MEGSKGGVRYQIALERDAKRSLERRIDSEIVKSIIRSIDNLEHDPYRGRTLKGPLKGKYRLTVRRHYRVVYRIDEQHKRVIVEKIAHRSKVYN